MNENRGGRRQPVEFNPANRQFEPVRHVQGRPQTTGLSGAGKDSLVPERVILCTERYDKLRHGHTPPAATANGNYYGHDMPLVRRFLTIWDRLHPVARNMLRLVVPHVKKLTATLTRELDPDGVEVWSFTPSQRPDQGYAGLVPLHDRRAQLDDVACAFRCNMHNRACYSSCHKYCRPGAPRVCRYRFPRECFPATIVQVELSADGQVLSARVLHERDRAWLNNRGPVLWSTAWRGNHDVQVILNPMGMAYYVTMYATKADTPDYEVFSRKLQQILAERDLYGTGPTLRRISNALISLVRFGLQHLAWLLLGHEFYEFSHEAVGVDL